MRIFISWSGDRGLHVALALRQWLRQVVHTSDPWMSASDIGAGRRWGLELAQSLQDSSFGIICVTPESQNSPWLLFEAGAVAKAIDSSLVCPYLIDMAPSDLQGPLAQFQAKTATYEPTWEIVLAVARAMSPALVRTELELRQSFEMWWPKLEAALRKLPSPPGPPPDPRSERELLVDILQLSRDTQLFLQTRSIAPVAPAMSRRFRMVLDAFGVLKPQGFREIGIRSTGFRGYFPADQDAGLHYELVDHGDEEIGVEIHIEDDPYRDRAPLLKGYVGRYESTFEHTRTYFDPGWANKRGRMVIAFGEAASPKDIATAMQQLIESTRADLWPQSTL